MATAHDASGVARRMARALARWEGEGGALDARDAVQMVHAEVEGTVRCLGVEVDDALPISEQVGL